jgi:membrane-associated phospholipid phosphatase
MSQKTGSGSVAMDRAEAHGRPPSAIRQSTLWRVVGTPWVRNLLIALAAIPLLMVFVDPAVGRWANAVRQTDAVWLLRKIVGPLGHGTPWGIAFLAALVAAATFRTTRYLKLALVIVLTFIWSGGLCHLIKITVHRPRPEIMWAPWLGDWGLSVRFVENQLHSFPSGDVTVAAGLVMVAFLLVGRGWARHLLFAVPVLSAIGRIAAARHYPSDCLAGMVLGIAVAAVMWRVVMGTPSGARAPTAPAVASSD